MELEVQRVGVHNDALVIPTVRQRTNQQANLRNSGWRYCNGELHHIAVDCLTLRRSQAARIIVFYAHSLVHGLAGSIPNSIVSNYVLLALEVIRFSF